MTRALVCFLLIVVLSCPVRGQSVSKPMAFEVADIHPSAPPIGIQNMILQGPFIAGTRFELRNATLLDMIRIAYSPAEPRFNTAGRRIDQLDADKVVGGPSGLDFERFDVVAKAPSLTSLANMKLMLQTLLANRFKLAVHNGSAPLPAYALTVGKKPLLKEADGTGDTGCKQTPQWIPGPGALIPYACRSITMAAFADALRSVAFSTFNDNRVVDQTGLEGAWNFDFKYSVPAPLSGTAPSDIVTLTAAVQKQLGLDLVLTTIPTPVLIVDRASDRPTPNPAGLAKALPPLPEEFEVADIKPTSPEFSATTIYRGGRIELQPGGRVVVENATLRRLIVRAWELPTRDADQLLLGPKFIDTAKFNILAKAPEFGPPPSDRAYAPTLPGPAPAVLMYPFTNDNSINPMLRSLLIKRFGLTFHYEDRPLPSMTLTSVKPKLQKADPTRRTGCQSAAGQAGSGLPTIVMTCQNITMAQFAENLPLYLITRLGVDTVVDATRLEGAWDFTLTFPTARGGTSDGGSNPFGGGARGERASDEPGGMTVFEAMEKQLGLKLESSKHPRKVMVIDHIDEKPNEP